MKFNKEAVALLIALVVVAWLTFTVVERYYHADKILRRPSAKPNSN